MSRGKLTMLATALAASAALVGGCAQSQTAGWKANNSTFAQSDQTMFLFFPQAAVYYQPDAKTWYWLEDECWFKGSTVPMVVSQNNYRPIIVNLDAPTPFEQEAVVFTTFNRNNARFNRENTSLTARQRGTSPSTCATFDGNTTQTKSKFATGESNRPKD